MDEPEPTVVPEPSLDIKIGIERGNVIIYFNQNLTTLGLPPEAAKKMGRALIKHAKQAKALTKS